MLCTKRSGFAAYFVLFLSLGVAVSEETYPLHPNSKQVDGVPRGKVTRHQLTQSEVYPGTERDYLVYVPSQYDREFLQVVDAMGRYVWSYQINPDGSLKNGQAYFYVHSPQDEMNTGADGCTMTEQGELLVATKLGVQIFDQPGRAHVILKRPKRGGRLSNLVFAGDDMQTLYATSGTSVYRRKTKMKGIAPSQKRVKPPKPRL